MRMGYLIVARLLGRKVWMERIGILYRNCQNHLGSSQQKMEIWPLKVSIILFLKEARTVDNGIIRSH